MESESNLTNHFLIAMPALHDPNFFHTVTYICEHNVNGAMGIVINRPMEMKLSDIFEHMQIDNTDQDSGSQQIFNGGPVEEERGFILHNYSQSWDSTLRITEELAITTSKDILEAIASDNGPEKSLVALGYAGWGQGQLENEMAENSWLSGPADTRIIFDLPIEQRWQAAAESIGVDLNLISTGMGHA